MRRELQEPGALVERLADEADVELLEVPQPAVDEPARSRGRADRDVVLLDERGTEPAAGRVEEGAAADDPAADDEDVPGLPAELLEVGTAVILWRILRAPST